MIYRPHGLSLWFLSRLGAALAGWVLFAVLGGCTSCLGTSPFGEALICREVPQSNGLQLCAVETDGGYPGWYLLGQGRPISVGIDASGPLIPGFEFSTSGRYLAVESVAEGHPSVELYFSAHLAEQGTAEFLQAWDGYPGWVSMTGWAGDDLLLESNVPLHQDYDSIVDYDDAPARRFRWDVRLERLLPAP